jgi:hypothetical protein
LGENEDCGDREVHECTICESHYFRWLDCDDCPDGECEEIICINCGSSL